MGDWKVVLWWAVALTYSTVAAVVYGRRQNRERRQEAPRPSFRRDRSVAIALAFFLGGLGVHKFYLGRPGAGMVYALFCWTFIPALVAFFEALWFLGMSNGAFDATYNGGM